MDCLACIQIADMCFIYIARSYQLKCTHSKFRLVVFFAQIEAISHRHEMTLKVCCIKEYTQDPIGGLVKSKFSNLIRVIPTRTPTDLRCAG